MQVSSASVVTFSIQVGSDGFSIAQSVAEKLGYHYSDWAITSRTMATLSSYLPVNIENRGFGDRMLARLAVANLFQEEVPESMLGSGSPEAANEAIQSLSDDATRASVEEIVRELAAAGRAVIVGHGSQIVLQGHPGVLKVLIRGSAETRARRIAIAQGMSYDEAANAVKESDRIRARFFRRAYGVNWLDGDLYDLAISTDEVPADVAASIIAAAAANVNGITHRPSVATDQSEHLLAA